MGIRLPESESQPVESRVAAWADLASVGRRCVSWIIKGSCSWRAIRADIDGLAFDPHPESDAGRDRMDADDSLLRGACVAEDTRRGSRRESREIG